MAIGAAVVYPLSVPTSPGVAALAAGEPSSGRIVPSRPVQRILAGVIKRRSPFISKKRSKEPKGSRFMGGFSREIERVVGPKMDSHRSEIAAIPRDNEPRGRHDILQCTTLIRRLAIPSWSLSFVVESLSFRAGSAELTTERSR
jgi:hypothetical protein